MMPSGSASSPVVLLIARLVAAVLLLLVAGYGAGALRFRGPADSRWRGLLLAGWISLAGAALLGLIRQTWLAPALFALAGLGLAAWWARITPRLDRGWAPDVSRLPIVERDGDHVRIHNVRNFVWRTRQDFTARWETRDYDASDIISVDLVVSYWAGHNIAHTLVAFAFADGRHLCFSVEVRRLDGERFSALGGLFRQCELALVAADERDVIRTRSNVRNESVHLFRVGLPRKEASALFHAYLDTTIRLRERPRFYNTLTANCTTLIYDMVHPIVPGVPWNWRLVVSGRLPGYLYRLGALDTRLSLDTLYARGRINERAAACDRGPGHTAHDFSCRIRDGLPHPVGWPAPPP